MWKPKSSNVILPVFQVFQMHVKDDKHEYAGDSHQKDKQILIRQRYPYIIIIDVQNPIKTDIMQEHPMMLTELESIAGEVEEDKRKD